MSFHFKHQLEEDNARLEKENEELIELVYRCRSMQYARNSAECSQVWGEVEAKLKQIKEGEKSE